MFDLSVVAKGGRWVLLEDEAGELGAFGSQAEALDAAGAYQVLPGDEYRHVLIQEESGEWDEVFLDAPLLQ